MVNQKILELHAIIEKKAQELEYGAATFTLTLKEGLPVLTTLQITKTKRFKNTDSH